MAETMEHVLVRVLGYCLMPNHWHLVLWPLHDGDLGRFIQRLTTTHVRRRHLYTANGRQRPSVPRDLQVLPVEDDDHLLTVMRYVERNPVRPTLVSRAEQWRWSSLWRR